MNRRLKKLIALALTVAMVFSLSMTSVFAYSSDIYSSKAPTETMEVDKTELSGATSRANTTAMSILGINVTSTDSAGTLNSRSDTDAPLNLLVFGSELNENPDPYLWNFYYNFNVDGGTYPNKAEEGDDNTGLPVEEWKGIYKLDDYKSWKGAYTLLNYANSGPTGAAPNTDVIPIQVNSTEAIDCNPLFYFEPNVLMGGTEGTYTTGLDFYKYESKINPNYTPLEVYGWGTSEELGQYAIRTGTIDSTFAMANGVYEMSVEIQNYVNELNDKIREESEESGKDEEPALISGRYGDVQQCGADYSNFALGIYYFLQNRLNPITPLVSQISKSTYCTGISIDGGTITVTNDCEEQFQGNVRYMQYVDDIADYAEKGKTYSSYGDLKKDVDLIIMDTSQLSGTQKFLLNHVNIKVVDIDEVMPQTVYGTTMQSADNILGLPYFVGLLYEGKLSSYSYGLSEYDYTAYFVKNIYHVCDDNNVKDVLTEMFRESGGDVYDTYERKGLTNGYDGYIQEMIDIGAWYYSQTEFGSGKWRAVDDGLL